MLNLRMPATLLIGAALALTLSACGSGASEGTSTTTPSTTTSPSDAPTSSSSTTPEPSNSGIVPDAAWAGVFKKAVPPLAKKTDDEVATAAKKVCTDFEASPAKTSADAILKGLETDLGLDVVQQQIFASGAITHFCTGQSSAWTTASIG